MPTDFNFDPTNSDLNIGLEVEYPRADTEDDLPYRGKQTMDLQDEVSRNPWPPHIGGRDVYDGTVGLEVVSDILNLEDAPRWYADVIDYVEAEYGRLYNPVGILNGGSTAGLHMHLSNLTHDQARTLYEMSMEPWARILFCSSIAVDYEEGVSWPVFRGGSHCREAFDGDGYRGRARYSVVNSRGDGHYEWRLPEPMKPEHLEVVVRFLRLFEQDPDLAREYAQEILDDADERVTSIWRAEMVGMDMDEMPDVRREQYEADSENFYHTIESRWDLPEIYNVGLDGRNYYLFETRVTGTFEVNGIEFRHDDVLYADTLQTVEDANLADRVRTAYQNSHDERRETAATDELKKIIKKK